MGYTPLRTVYRLAREQLHLNKAKLRRSKFSYLDQYESCLAYQPFLSSCHSYLLRATGQNFRYSVVNCALGPSKSIRYGGVRYNGVCFHIFYCNFAGLSYVVRYNGVFVIAGCHCISKATKLYSLPHRSLWRRFGRFAWAGKSNGGAMEVKGNEKLCLRWAQYCFFYFRSILHNKNQFSDVHAIGHRCDRSLTTCHVMHSGQIAKKVSLVQSVYKQSYELTNPSSNC